MIPQRGHHQKKNLDIILSFLSGANNFLTSITSTVKKLKLKTSKQLISRFHTLGFSQSAVDGLQHGQ